MAQPSKPLELCALVAGVRLGESEAIAQFSNTLEQGARFLLRRYPATGKVDSAVSEYVAEAMDLVQGSTVGHDRIPTAAWELIHQQIARRTKTSQNDKPVRHERSLFAAAVAPELAVRRRGVIEWILATLAPDERNALGRYYAGESEEQVCATTGLFLCEFQALRRQARDRYFQRLSAL